MEYFNELRNVCHYSPYSRNAVASGLPSFNVKEGSIQKAYFTSVNFRRETSAPATSSKM